MAAVSAVITLIFPDGIYLTFVASNKYYSNHHPWSFNVYFPVDADVHDVSGIANLTVYSKNELC